MLADRTQEHLDMFREDSEAVYFGSTAEFVEKVRLYLEKPVERNRIASAAHDRVMGSHCTYKDRLARMFEEVEVLRNSP